MESQVQIQSDTVEIVLPCGSNSMDINRQRQQTSPVNSNSSTGQQKHQKPQMNSISRVVIVSPSVQPQSSVQSMANRSTPDSKHVIVSQQSHHSSTTQLQGGLAQRQLIIPTVPQTADVSRPQILTNGQQQQMTTSAAAVQNGQLVLTSLTNENRGRPRPQQQQQQQPQQQQLHRQQQILIIQQPDRIINEHEKDDEHEQQKHSLPLGVAQTITVAVSDPDGTGTDPTSAAIYPALQYVTNTGEPVGTHHLVAAHHHSNSSAQSAADSSHVIYHHSPVPTSNQHPAVHLQSGTYTVYPGDGGGYSPQGHHYYTSQVSYQTPLHSPTSAYIIQSSGGGLQHSPIGGATGCNPVLGVHEEEAAAQQLSHTTRASPATIQWLLQNYETAEGVSLPRCTLYNHYLKHCSEHKLDPVNAASFGKLIRSVFLGLRTRRLGTRGNSKYHYYGIRIKPDSPLNRISEESMATMAMRQQPTGQSRRPRPMLSTPPAPPLQAPTTVGGTPVSGQNQQSSSLTASSSNVTPVPQHNQSVITETGSTSGTPSSIHSGTSGLPPTTGQQQPVSTDGNKQYLGDGVIRVPDVIPPPVDQLEGSLERLGLTVEHSNRFFTAYRTHCEDILECVKNLLFSDVERYWRQFWQPDELEGNKQPSSLDRDVESDLDDEDSILGHNTSGLTRMQLYSLCTLPIVQEYVQTMDFQFYQVIVDVLIPTVLKPIPSSLTQAIRNFAKRLESGLGLALHGAPDVIMRIKLDAVGSLAQTLRRYTSLNHLAQAARAVLQNGAQIQQMLMDLNRVDFHNVQEQASWVCDCDTNIVDQIEKDFKNALERQKTLEQWGSWLETVVDQVLGGYDIMNGRQEHDASVVRLTTLARQFLLKWSFYSSMVMRDLTLRSAPSFGSFHLIRLLYDEYMFYLVEQRVARLTGQTTIAVMSQSYRNHIASLATSDQDYQAYQMQHLHEQQLLTQDDHGQQEMDTVEGYENQDQVKHHFVGSDTTTVILNAPSNDDGEASLTAMDRPSTEAVVMMTTQDTTIPVTGANEDVVTTSYVVSDQQGGGDQIEGAQERSVVDEYFITIQEDHQDNQLAPSTDQSGDTSFVLTATTTTMDWAQGQKIDDTDPKTDHTSTSEKVSSPLETSPPKKRKTSTKFNGDTGGEDVA